MKIFKNCLENEVGTRKLIGSGINLNIKDRYDQTPMHLAAQKRFIKIIKLLVGKGWLFQIQRLI